MEKALTIAHTDQLPAAQERLSVATTDVEITAATIAVLACMGRDYSPITHTVDVGNLSVAQFENL